MRTQQLSVNTVKIVVILAAVLLLGIPAAEISAQDALVSGLHNPRGVFYDENGTLYIAEAGRGGDTSGQGAFGPAMFGGTGQITVVGADGATSVLLANLPSRDEGGEVIGPSGMAIDGEILYIVLSQGDLRTPFTYTIAALDRVSLRLRFAIDVYSAEAAQNPDGDIVDSNPVDVAVADDGTLYIADAGANTVWRWIPNPDSSTLESFAVWTDSPVPTSIAIAENGDLLIGFLTGFQFPEGGSRIERWSSTGELLETYTGLSTVVDVQVATDGTVYAVEIARFGDMGWIPNTGRVVSVSANGITPVMENLNFPYGLAQAPDGSWVVGINSAYVGAGTGAVIRVGAGGTGDSAGAVDDAQPVTTPEAGS